MGRLGPERGQGKLSEEEASRATTRQESLPDRENNGVTQGLTEEGPSWEDATQVLR